MQQKGKWKITEAEMRNTIELTNKAFFYVKEMFATQYRETQQVSDRGWVDLDLGCSTNLLGQ